MSLLRNYAVLGICSNGFPEAAAALEVMLLLLFGEAEFGIEHVLWTYEGAERRGEGVVHFECGFFWWGFFRCFWVVEENRVFCVDFREKEEGKY